MFSDRFHFVNPGPLIDGDLELVAPDERLIDEVLLACSHPLTQLYAPVESQITREQLVHFVKNVPLGHELGNGQTGKVPQYHFWMRLRDEACGKPASPAIRIVGGIALRVGWTPSIEMYYGHLGYHVYPAARGRHYALRACRLILPIARQHGFEAMWITCNPDNAASRRTCESLGAKLIETVRIPESEPLFARGETHKCRYWLDLMQLDR